MYANRSIFAKIAVHLIKIDPAIRPMTSAGCMMPIKKNGGIILWKSAAKLIIIYFYKKKPQMGVSNARIIQVSADGSVRDRTDRGRFPLILNYVVMRGKIIVVVTMSYACLVDYRLWTV